MSQEIKSYASEISELMFENTDKIPEGIYLEVMNKLKKVVESASKDKTIITYQNIDFKDKYIDENTKNNALTAGLLHTMFKPIETNPNLSKYDYIDLNYCLNVKEHNGNTSRHSITEMLSVEFEDYYDLDAEHAFLRSFMTTTCLRGNMLCLFTNNWMDVPNTNRRTLSRDYIGNYYVNDMLHYEYCFERGELGHELHNDVDVFIKILKLNKKNMLVNIYIHVKNTVGINKTEIRAIKQAKVHLDYQSLWNIYKLVPDEMTFGKVPWESVFHYYIQCESQDKIKLDFETDFYETDIME
jgi:hypothetical protein